MATADALLSQIKTRCFWPLSGSAPLTDAEILSFADAEIIGDLWPDLLAAQGDYYLSTFDHAITVDVTHYRIPKTAYGPIKDVLYVDSDGDEVSIGALNVEEIGHDPEVNGPAPYLHYIEGDFIGLHPKPTSTTGSLRIRMYRHPNALVLVTAAKQVTSVDLSIGRLTFGSDPDALFNVGQEIDVLSAGNAHQVLVDEIGIASFSGGNSINVVGGTLVGTGVQADDWVALTGQTPIVQVPDSMVPLLAFKTALACLAAAGDKEGFALCMAWGQQLEGKQKKLLEPRSEAEPRTVNTRHSTLWAGRRRAGAWR